MNSRAIVNVVDDLNSTSTIDALSANQGRILKEQIDAINVSDNDSGWQDIVLSNGAVAYSTAQRPQCRKVNKQVFIRGVFKGVATTPVVIGTLPVGYRPTAQVIFMNCGTGNRVDRFEIKANGDINYASATEAPLVESWHALHTSYLVD